MAKVLNDPTIKARSLLRLCHCDIRQELKLPYLLIKDFSGSWTRGTSIIALLHSCMSLIVETPITRAPPWREDGHRNSKRYDVQPSQCSRRIPTGKSAITIAVIEHESYEKPGVLARRRELQTGQPR